MSGWGDGLVTFSFSNRLKVHQKKLTRPDTTARPEDRERRQQSKPRQQEQGTGSRAPRSRDAQNSTSATHTRRPTSADARPRTTSMTTRSPTSRLNNNHAQPKSPSTTTAPSDAKEVPAPTTNAAAPAVRAARLTALSSTNLNALFRTHDTPVAGTPLPVVYASTTARVRSVLERSAGDYSRFLPRTVGVRKSASPPAFRTARHALAAQRDVSLAQRRVALHIIGGLAQPGRQVSA